MPHAQCASRLRVACAAATLVLVPTAPAPAGDDDMTLGREIFLETSQPPCGACHSLADADAGGDVAPDLDDMRPTHEEVMEAMRSGPGVMPDYRAQLSDAEMEAVAAYVSEVAGGP